MPRTAELLIVGGGPAGSAVLLAAARLGALPELCAAGLVIAERGNRLGAGALGGYAIHSDSTAATFLASVTNHPDPNVAAVAVAPAARAMSAGAPGNAVALPLAGAFLDDVGAALRASTEAAGGRVLTGHAVIGLRREQHLWVASLQPQGGPAVTVAARHVVMATGGEQTEANAAAAQTAIGPLGAVCGNRLVLSDRLLAEGGIEALSEQLRGVARPRVTVLGGSTSALASVRRILDSDIGARMATGALTLVHRRMLRPFYRSAAEAHADGFTDFGPEDICPVSGFVLRLGGLRLDARDIVLHAMRIGGRTPDPRLRLMRPTNTPRAIRALEDAHSVIAATGYQPRALPVADEHGHPVALQAATPKAGPMVDGYCRVLDATGAPLPGLFGIGLGAGFVPYGRLGGEASFRGQANGLWLWQNDVGNMIIEQIRRDSLGARSMVA